MGGGHAHRSQAFTLQWDLGFFQWRRGNNPRLIHSSSLVDLGIEGFKGEFTRTSHPALRSFHHLTPACIPTPKSLSQMRADQVS